MLSFIISLLVLILGYVFYGSFVQKVFGADKERKTPAFTHSDGVDYVPMKWWRAFLIQFLNIAGLGPIFGAIMGAMYGTASFIWIVLGTIFAGATHDYVSGMLSVRNGGESLPEIVGQQLGIGVKQVMRIFTIVLLILVGAVFISGPAGLLNGLVPKISIVWWVVIVFMYYVMATLLPIDKLIGRLYPVFGFALLFMALGILIALFRNNAPIPEISDGLSIHPQHLPIFPMMFVSIACGAISGFHATQSPLMARCLTNERLGKRVFYGAMVAEGIVALIWAAAASSFFGSIGGLQEYVASLPKNTNAAAEVVNLISHSWLGIIGGALAMLGVVAAPITSGDTALRSARLIIADFLHIEQKSLWKRIAIALPLFIACFILLQINFDILWRYFAWSNQTLSVFTLWALTLWFARRKVKTKAMHYAYIITLIPAMFMTAVCITYILFAPEGFSLPYLLSVFCGIGVSIVFAVLFFIYNVNKKYLL
ncbi:MAG: carbon starvation protein A [Bacteroidales bacterium]|jgi:carbon starvation protein CstA|nr:carbon starvation protein A [Bacteroidales bacterium]